VRVIIKIRDAKLRRKYNKVKATLVQNASMDVVRFLKEYHTRFRLSWRGLNHMQGPKSDQFWQQVVNGWQDPVTTTQRAIITNNFGLLDWKVSGGTIEPIAAKALTIPLVPEAKGLRADEFIAAEGTPLFRVGSVLARRIGKQLQAIYALKEMVTQDPWPGAMPNQSAIEGVFTASLERQIVEGFKSE
jgi:hypothetical protein